MSYLIGEAMTGGYGSGADILHACTIAVDRGEIAVIVGPNGAGKSTAMKAVFGMLNLRSGQVRLDGQDITNMSPQERVRAGMGLVPQTSNVFTSMTVEENLEMGAYIREDDFGETMEQVFALFPILKQKRSRRASSPAASASRSPSAARS
jgi:branched-chain amino acid transport system ATP-binding protein